MYTTPYKHKDGWYKIHPKLIDNKIGREHSSIVQQLIGKQYVCKVSITEVSRAMKQKTMSMVAIIYIMGR